MEPKNTVIKNVHECLKELGLPAVDPFLADPKYAVASHVSSNGVLMVFQINHEPEKHLLALIIYFPARVTWGEGNAIFEVMNEFNARLPLGHFAIDKFTNKVTFRFGYPLLEEAFNKKKFKKYFHQMVSDARDNYPFLQRLISEEGANT
jgi:hypothetical protein